MNLFGPIAVKRLFRREPIISGVVTAAMVNVLLGTLEGQVGLAWLGLAVAGGAVSWRAWRSLSRPRPFTEASPVRYLPDSSSRPTMPIVDLSPDRRSPPPRR
ncbi:hypothetical protein [Leptolyngbya sp. PCC 6406]|uniref:hypothetical protein n=1 Tax=Leptolyngbya sp. PCC 6406 TaxID=1173264 RepID=UPI0002ABA62A|nr:hypothetical protein [Leptolyngbya sp. PCC 6406]